MKIYLITESSERMIRCATLTPEKAQQIVDCFQYIGLEIHEVEVIE